MAMSIRLELRQGQSLVMTPQLQQAIKLLQLSNVELTEFVESELQENPLLERDEGPDGAEPDGQGEGTQESALGDDPKPLKEGDFSLDEQPLAPGEGALDQDYNTVWDTEGDAQPAGQEYSAPAEWGNAGGGGFDGDGYNLEQTIAQSVSLRDHLLGQVQVELNDPADRMIGAYLVDMLDDAGRLGEDLDMTAVRLGCPLERVEAVLGCLQRLDPPGLFARDLAECWAIQLAERDRLDPAMQTLLDNIDLLEKHDFTGLAKLCQLNMEDIQDMIEEIRSLNHHPASAFDEAPAQPVIPDVIMRLGPDGGWFVELNNDTLPKVLINNHYYTEISAAVRTKEEKQYVAEKIQLANWLVKALHQRATTILRVAEEIIRQQDGFFHHGIEHLRPLILRDIADEIEMHESTVSRVTSNKYIHTPRGIFELKYFFTPAIGSSQGGEAHSAESVRHRIKTLIDGEPPSKVLSDDKMVEILQGEGIDIARRTVAKYRETMRIPSSVRRRRQKAAAL